MNVEAAHRLPSLDRLVSTDDLANHFNVTTQTIRNWVVRGLIPAPFRIGRRLAWKLSQLEAFLARLS